MKRLILIFPRPISEFPSGFAYLNAIAKKSGWGCKAVVNTFKKNYTNDDIIKEIVHYGPSIIGINIGTLRILDTYELIRKIRSVSLIRNILIIAGGPHATTRPDEVLKAGVDIVVRNEGEVTLSEILDATKNYILLDQIKGISFKDCNGNIFHTPMREYADFKDLPKPDYDCFNYDDFKTSDGLIKGLHRIYCSRGCPGSCTFCDSAIFGKKVRYRPLEDIIEEIDFRYETYRINSFIIADDTFTSNKQFVKDFCQALRVNNLPIIWGCSTRANAIDKELLQCMKQAGCYMVGLGIESGDTETLMRIKKHITLEQAYNAIRLISGVGMRVYVNLMTGFPWETVGAVRNNIKLIKECFDDVFIYQVSGSLCPYPGTGIYEEWKDKADIKDWWLRPDYQDYGIQIHQNTTEPYKLSTYYQRKLYDDTYIWEDKFFKYTKEYKRAVKEMAFLVGKRLLLSETHGKIKRIGVMTLSRISRFFYELNPNLEKSIIPKIVKILNVHNSFHDRGPLGYIKRK